MNIQNCSRCGGDHVEVAITKLDRPFAPPECAPIQWTHFALCPTNGNPIIVMIRGDEPAAQHVIPSGSQAFEDALPIVYQVFQERRAATNEVDGFASTVRELYGKWKPA